MVQHVYQKNFIFWRLQPSLTVTVRQKIDSRSCQLTPLAEIKANWTSSFFSDDSPEMKRGRFMFQMRNVRKKMLKSVYLAEI